MSWMLGKSPDESFLIEVQKGNVSGHSMVHKFGRNMAVPNGSWEFINQLGSTGWPLSVAETVRVAAGHAQDSTGGSGAREITIQGIDSNLNEVTATLTPAGTSAGAASSDSFWRVHRCWISSAGTYGGANTSDVTVEDSSGAQSLIQIAEDEGQTQFGGFTVPTGKTGYLLSVHIQVDANKAADIRCFTRKDIDDVTVPVKSKRLRLYFDGVLGEFQFIPSGPEFSIDQKSDIWFEANGSGALTEVSCEFSLLLVDN